MRIFGIPIIADFSDPGDLDQKIDRYNELTPYVDHGMDRPEEVDDEEWKSKMEEQVDLYYELRERTNCPDEDEDEQPRGFWGRLFG